MSSPDFPEIPEFLYNTPMERTTLNRLIPAHYRRILPLFEGYLADPLMHAVIEGSRPGRVYADSADQPAAAVVWTETECVYVAGDPQNETFNLSLRHLIENTIIPTAKALDMDFISLFAHPAGYPARLEELLSDLEPLRTPANTFKFNPDRFSERQLPSKLPKGMALTALDAELLHDPENEGLLDGILHYWGTVEAFLRQSHGYALLDGERVVSWLYVQASGGGGQAPDSWTDPEYRGRGLASLVGRRWIKDCLANSQQPFWLNDQANRASRRLAERIGFDYTGNVDLVDVPFYPFEYFRGMARHFFLVNDSYREAAESFERAFLLGSADPMDYYLAAASWMHAEDPQNAMQNLHRAVDHGLEDLLTLEGTDAFEELRGTPAWENLVQHYLRSRRIN
jgi:GNAT superfamily N-acetyltransferase